MQVEPAQPSDINTKISNALKEMIKAEVSLDDVDKLIADLGTKVGEDVTAHYDFILETIQTLLPDL